MNYLELRVDTRNGKGPVMLEGYHDKEVSFWYGDMMDYDRNITKMVKFNKNHVSFINDKLK